MRVLRNERVAASIHDDMRMILRMGMIARIRRRPCYFDAKDADQC
jgi:hypothetical protein